MHLKNKTIAKRIMKPKRESYKHNLSKLTPCLSKQAKKFQNTNKFLLICPHKISKNAKKL